MLLAEVLFCPAERLVVCFVPQKGLCLYCHAEIAEIAEIFSYDVSPCASLSAISARPYYHQREFIITRDAHVPGFGQLRK